MSAPTIIGGYSSDDVKRRLEQCGRQNGYQVEEWLIPSAHGGLRVAATLKHKGQKHGYGFKWNGEDLNELAQRCIALDFAMTKLPEAIAQGEGALWRETEH